MAKNISEVGIATGEIVFATHVLQLTDALRGDEAYNLPVSGNISINGNLHPTGSGNADEVMITNGSGVLTFGVPNAATASYVTSSNVDGPFGFDSVLTASHAITASYVNFDSTVKSTFVNQTLVDVAHNLKSDEVLVQAYDTSGALPLQIQPTNVRITDDNNVRVTFSGNTTGYIVITRGGFVQAGNAASSISASYALTASHVTGLTNNTVTFPIAGAASYTLSHNIGRKYVVVQAYNTLDEQVIPTLIRAVSTNDVLVQFTSVTDGNVVITG